LILSLYYSDAQNITNQNVNQIVKRTDKALLIATDNYDNYPDLVNPIEDAKAIGDELSSIYGFEVEILENPSLEEIYSNLREYALTEYEKFDQLFIFFAGHGLYDQVFKEGFLIAKDSKTDDSSFNTLLSHNRLRNMINNIPSNHIFLVIDACFSGTIDPTISSSGSRAIDPYKEINNLEYVAKKLKYNTRKFLTSGGVEYVSDGVKGRHSPFTRKFLEALRDQGGQDQILSIAEILPYMEKISPTPRFGSFGDDEPGSDMLFISTTSEALNDSISRDSNDISYLRSNNKHYRGSLGIGVGEDLIYSNFYYKIWDFLLGIGFGDIEFTKRIEYNTLEGLGPVNRSEVFDINYLSLNAGYSQRVGPINLNAIIGLGTNTVKFGEFSINFLRFRKFFAVTGIRYYTYKADYDEVIFNQFGSANYIQKSSKIKRGVIFGSIRYNLFQKQ
jgi:hypothetical protein